MNRLNLQKGVSSASVSITNGRIECQFTRQASSDSVDSTYFDLSGANKYYIIMAKGDQVLADGECR